MIAATPSISSALKQMTADKAVALTILVSALGYFVDIFDLLLFSIVRVQSLKDIGVPEADLLSVGIELLNAQMAGLLIGGIIWGVIGDKFGRVSVLFGSILLYSLGNIGNGFVQTVDQYAALRFFTGLGLAGELGVGVTLASELLPKEIRGLGAAFIAFIGILGATVAYGISDFFGWREAYIVGGVMGLLLLVLRVNVCESGLYSKQKGSVKARGNILMLFKPALLKKYVQVILVGAPLWAVVGILITLSPEFAKDFGLTIQPSAGKAVMFCYAGCAVAGLLTGLLSQYLRSRRKAIFWCLMLLIVASLLYFTVRIDSLPVFYAICALLGFGSGYWSMFVQVGAEQFGTNIRATAATSIPNVVRGLVIPMTAGFHALIPSLGVSMSGAVVMGVVLSLALLALWQMSETFHADLDYIEG